MRAKRLWVYVVVIGFFIAAILLLGFVLVQHNNHTTQKQNVPAGYVQVKSYHYYEDGELVCGANAPGCGVCEEEDIGGVIIDKKCYVPKSSPFAGY